MKSETIKKLQKLHKKLKSGIVHYSQMNSWTELIIN